MPKGKPYLPTTAVLAELSQKLSCHTPPGPMYPLYFTEADSTLIPTLGVPSGEVAFHFSPAEPGGAPVPLLGCR